MSSAVILGRFCPHRVVPHHCHCSEIYLTKNSICHVHCLCWIDCCIRMTNKWLVESGCHRWWSNIVWMLYKCFVFTGIGVLSPAELLIQSLFNAGPVSTSLAQHVFWDRACFLVATEAHHDAVLCFQDAHEYCRRKQQWLFIFQVSSYCCVLLHDPIHDSFINSIRSDYLIV